MQRMPMPSWNGLTSETGWDPPRQGYLMFNYLVEDFNFPAAVRAALGEPDLERLGVKLDLPLRTRETDQLTSWHRLFYDQFASWRPLYESFVRRCVAGLFKERFFYQAVPTFRVHLPGNLAVGEFHTDSEYGHPDGELTFWVPLTRTSDTSSIWIETSAGHGDYDAVGATPGDVVAFDAGRLRHGNLRNTTGLTRVSFDVRCLLERDYRDTGKRSINAGLAFAPGGYYAADTVEPLG